MTLVPSLRNPGPALSNSFKSQVTPISLSFGQSYMKPIHITFPSTFCSQPLALASNCCLTSNKSLCPNHNGKNYQRTGHHLVIRRSSNFAVLGYITSTLIVSTLTRHSKIFFTGQFNKRRLCYKTNTKQRDYVRSLFSINTAMCGHPHWPCWPTPQGQNAKG